MPAVGGVGSCSVLMPALYVIRHAIPEITGVLSGQSDPPLSASGREKAAALHVPAGVVYSSPLRRARETAAYLNPWPIIRADLAEISYGAWDGLSWDEIEMRWPDIASAKIGNWTEVTPPGAESWKQFSGRVRRGLAEIVRGPLPAAIIAHEAVNAIIANLLTGSPVNNYKQNYCEIKKYDL
jgi:alpha-ribazole phosphatase